MTGLLILSIACCFPLENPSSGISLFQDTLFEQGFLLSYSSSAKGRQVEKILHGKNQDSKPVWRLCQWATSYSLAKAQKHLSSSGDIIFANKGKKVVIGGTQSQNHDLVLEIRGKEEYKRPRESGESWPHLLVEQDAQKIIPLNRINRLNLQIALKLLAFEDHMKDNFDPNLHAAQFQLFLIVKNINRDSKEYGNFFWFGVPFFDNRHDIPPGYRAKDAGKSSASGKFIYTIPGREIMQDSLKNMHRKTIKKDLLPFIKSGIECAVKRKYLKSSDIREYAVVNMNLGWEIPGTYNASIQIRDFKIKALVSYKFK